MDHAIPKTNGSLRVVAALSIAALFVVIGWKNGAVEVQSVAVADPIQDMSFETREYLTETDTDGDSLPDWQEALLGTDPQKADSDGDGTADSAEPQLTVAQALELFAASSSEDMEPVDRISSRLVGEYMNLKNRSAYTPEKGDRLGQELATYVTYNTEFMPFTESDIVVSTDSSTEALEVHRKAMQKALDPFLDLSIPEFVIYANYVESGDERALAELSVRAATYRTVAREILRIPAPAGIKNEHLEIANALSFFSTVLDHLVSRVNDPIATLALLKTYNEAEQYIRTTFSVLVAYYREQLYKTI